MTLHWLHLGRVSIGIADHRRYRPFTRCVGYHSAHVGPYCLRLRVATRPNSGVAPTLTPAGNAPSRAEKLDAITRQNLDEDYL